MTALASPVLETSGFKLGNQFSDLRWHSLSLKSLRPPYAPISGAASHRTGKSAPLAGSGRKLDVREIGKDLVIGLIALEHFDYDRQRLGPNLRKISLKRLAD